MDKIRKIVEATHRISKSLNLFEGYVPKRTEGKTLEVLFWRDVVSFYGLFCDCDRIQFREKESLFDLFERYSLISKKQYRRACEFYELISVLRSWFCHNYDRQRYYARRKDAVLQGFLEEITVSGEVPSDPEEMDWAAADAYIRKRFEEYLDLLTNALRAIETSVRREEIKDEWCVRYAKALFQDRELLDNVLAENYEYACIDQGIRMRGVGKKTREMRQKLENSGYSYKDIHNSIVENANEEMTASELVRESIKGYDLLTDES